MQLRGGRVVKSTFGTILFMGQLIDLDDVIARHPLSTRIMSATWNEKRIVYGSKMKIIRINEYELTPKDVFGERAAEIEAEFDARVPESVSFANAEEARRKWLAETAEVKEAVSASEEEISFTTLEQALAEEERLEITPPIQVPIT